MSLVLIVDDESDILFIERLALEGAGYEVVEAPHGGKALEAIASRRPDIVLTDRNMPVMDGLELIRRLHSDPATADIPIVLVTANSGGINNVQVFLKPFDIDRLVDMVNNVIGKAG